MADAPTEYIPSEYETLRFRLAAAERERDALRKQVCVLREQWLTSVEALAAERDHSAGLAAQRDAAERERDEFRDRIVAASDYILLHVSGGISHETSAWEHALSLLAETEQGTP